LWPLFVEAEDGIRDATVTGVQTCALPISFAPSRMRSRTVGSCAASAIVSVSSTVCERLLYALRTRDSSAVVENWRASRIASAIRSEERRVGNEGGAARGREHEDARRASGA